jgi:hypothetical protein
MIQLMLNAGNVGKGTNSLLKDTDAKRVNNVHSFVVKTD